jgi:hypothetical protein
MSSLPTKEEFARFEQEMRDSKSKDPTDLNLIMATPFLKNVVMLLEESIDRVGGHGPRMHDIRLNSDEMLNVIAALKHRERQLEKLQERF